MLGPLPPPNRNPDYVTDISYQSEKVEFLFFNCYTYVNII